MNRLQKAHGNGIAASRLCSEMPFELIADDLDEAERILTDVLAPYRSPIAPLIQHLRHYRGKRLRPALLLLCAKACGSIQPEHHTLAAVVEMIHTATLVHDDVLDEAETRRHVQTFNQGWGNKISILLGDLLFTHAFHLSSRVDRRACEWIGQATNRVCAGELLQVTERGNLHLSETDYFAIIEGKTAALTEVAGRLGAIYAGASAEVVDALAAYGRHLGMAFQIADDLLDLTGDTGTVGKTLGTDLEQQKLTLPLIHALNRLSPQDADELRCWIRSNQSRDRIAILNRLEETDSLQYARRRAEEFSRNARASLAVLTDSECKAILEMLAAWSIRRNQ
jgi:octaprenyl-diphosphate synthase